MVLSARQKLYLLGIGVLVLITSLGLWSGVLLLEQSRDDRSQAANQIACVRGPELELGQVLPSERTFASLSECQASLAEAPNSNDRAGGTEQPEPSPPSPSSCLLNGQCLEAYQCQLQPDKTFKLEITQRCQEYADSQLLIECYRQMGESCQSAGLYSQCPDHYYKDAYECLAALPPDRSLESPDSDPTCGNHQQPACRLEDQNRCDFGCAYDVIKKECSCPTVVRPAAATDTNIPGLCGGEESRPCLSCTPATNRFDLTDSQLYFGNLRVQTNQCDLRQGYWQVCKDGIYQAVSYSSMVRIYHPEVAGGLLVPEACIYEQELPGFIQPDPGVVLDYDVAKPPVAQTNEDFISLRLNPNDPSSSVNNFGCGPVTMYNLLVTTGAIDTMSFETFLRTYYPSNIQPTVIVGDSGQQIYVYGTTTPQNLDAISQFGYEYKNIIPSSGQAFEVDSFTQYELDQAIDNDDVIFTRENVGGISHFRLIVGKDELGNYLVQDTYFDQNGQLLENDAAIYSVSPAEMRIYEATVILLSNDE